MGSDSLLCRRLEVAPGGGGSQAAGWVLAREGRSRRGPGRLASELETFDEWLTHHSQSPRSNKNPTSKNTRVNGSAFHDIITSMFCVIIASIAQHARLNYGCNHKHAASTLAPSAGRLGVRALFVYWTETCCTSAAASGVEQSQNFAVQYRYKHNATTTPTLLLPWCRLHLGWELEHLLTAWTESCCTTVAISGEAALHIKQNPRRLLGRWRRRHCAGCWPLPDQP